MIRKTLSIALVALGIYGGAASAVPPVPPFPSVPSPEGSIRCYAHDYRVSCGYTATYSGRLWAARAGAWTARIYRNHQLVWQVGGAFAYSMFIPSQPGDRVEIRLIVPSDCSLAEPVENPFCGGTGAVIATEGIDPPYLP